VTRRSLIFGPVLWLFALWGFCAAQTSADPVLNAMQQELNRSFQNLKKTDVPPYFLSYQLTDNRAHRIRITTRSWIH